MRISDWSSDVCSSDLNSLWKDGAQSSKVFAGIQSIIVDDPTTGVAAGIDRATNTWWRNRALVGTNKVTHSTSDQTLTKKLRSEVRQLRRHGGRPTLVLCGSAAIERLEAKIHEKGVYPQTGFINKGDRKSTRLNSSH